jgi:hypothetical protein
LVVELINLVQKILRQKHCIHEKCGVLCGRPSEKRCGSTLETGMGQSFQLDFSEAGTMGLKSLCRSIRQGFFAQQERVSRTDAWERGATWSICQLPAMLAGN